MALFTASSLSSLVIEQDGSQLRSSAPERAVTAYRPAPTPKELDGMTWDSVYAGPLDLDSSNAASRIHSMPITPISENLPPTPLEQLIMSEPQMFPVVHSWSSPPITKWRILTCCLLYFTLGMNDSALGALIPLMETHYNINYATVSLIFVSTAIGFLMATPFTDYLRSKLGYAKVYVLSEVTMAAMYGVYISTPPFPAVVVAAGIVGWAMASNLALTNVYCANLDHSTVVLGAAQGVYSIGGVVGPIVATTMTSGQGWIWSRYYILTLVVCLFGAGVAGWSFHGFESEQEAEALEMESLQRPVSSERLKPGGWAMLVKALKINATLIGALFTFAYQGAEVAISGWTISFLITERHGDPAHVGYVTAGFWVSCTLSECHTHHFRLESH
jgi:fucose permease